MNAKHLVLFVACCIAARGAAAQTLPDEPISVGDGRLVVSGDLAASIAPEDTGFFDYSDYEHSALREFRVSATALVRASDRISILGEFRSENLNGPTPFALYARIRPFPRRRLDIQIGRIPPTFGRFPRQAYSRDNPLIGYPLAYQYLTSLRPDAIPATPDELLSMRARGWLSNFTVGDQSRTRGVPLVTAFNWDTGVQATTGWKALTVTGAVTAGTASNPRVSDDNAGKQIATRVTVAATPGLTLGTSFARGQFLNRRVLALVGEHHESFSQQAYGADAEYSRGHLTMRVDTVLSEWRMPFVAIQRTETLRALALGGEGRYAFLPGAYAAARVEHLGFNRIAGTGRPLEWEAPVSRVEIGGGYYLQRNVVARVSLQINDRDGGRVTHARLLAGQLLYWF
jgi:hypothetical protein